MRPTLFALAVAAAYRCCLRAEPQQYSRDEAMRERATARWAVASPDRRAQATISGDSRLECRCRRAELSVQHYVGKEVRPRAKKTFKKFRFGVASQNCSPYARRRESSSPPRASRMSSSARKRTPNQDEPNTPDIEGGGGSHPSAFDSPLGLPKPEQLLTWIDQVQAELGTLRLVLDSMIRELRRPRREVSADLPSMMTDEEAAKELGYEPSTIKAWCRRNEFPGAKNMGKAGWRVPRALVESFEKPIRKGGTKLQRAS